MTTSTLFRFKGNETNMKHLIKDCQCDSVSVATEGYLCHLGNG